MKILYFDCFSGISGDMTIGAFLDIGVDFEYLKNELLKLNLSGYSLKCEKILKNGILSTKFNVLDENGNIFGHAPAFTHCHEHNHLHHKHHNTHDYHHDDHYHDYLDNSHTNTNHSEHHHKKYSDIKNMIESSKLNNNVKNIACKIFENIAYAESKIHGLNIDDIYFHEVGAIDSIIDIVGTAICIDALNIKECVVSKIPISFGFIRTAHGLWPNPAPATLELLKGFTLTKTSNSKELVTPTGAGIIKTLCNTTDDISNFSVEKIGYGAGYYDFEHPNVLRIMLCEKKN